MTDNADTAATGAGPRGDYGQLVRTARRARSLTLRDVARETGVSLGFLSEIERDLANPSIAVAQKLADVLGVNPIVTADYQGAYAEGERAGFEAGYLAACVALSEALSNRRHWWQVPSPESALAAWKGTDHGQH